MAPCRSLEYPCHTRSHEIANAGLYFPFQRLSIRDRHQFLDHHRGQDQHILPGSNPCLCSWKFFVLNCCSQTDVTVPLRPTSSRSPKEDLYKSANFIALPSPEKLHQFQELVAGAKSGNVTVAESMAQVNYHPIKPRTYSQLSIACRRRLYSGEVSRCKQFKRHWCDIHSRRSRPAHAGC